MTKYIENLNLYLDARKIKQTYLSMKTGIDAKKMSRILTGVQDITGTDMEKISAALGENTEYFYKIHSRFRKCMSRSRKKSRFMQESLQRNRKR